MQPTRNTLSENIRAQSVGLLNKHLAVAIDQQLWLVESHMRRNERAPVNQTAI
jgi:starvation-inducible DNA-binding protein